jgi:uncharacterized protein (DUF4213/DUF364 family)
MTLNMQNRLLEHLKAKAGGAAVVDVRIGLGYTAVQLESGQAGVAWTPKSDAPCCTHFQQAGTLKGRPAMELLGFLADEKSSLARAVGLATANALLASLPRPAIWREEIISTLEITTDDRVAMVGYFGPVVSHLRKIGCTLDIIELNPHRGETITPEQGQEALSRCSVAILTGTSLINGTLDELLAALGNPRAAVLLGPSSPLCPEVFAETRITHLAGARVTNAEAVLQIVSEGGGTMLMKKHLDFETAPVRAVR